MSPRRRSPLAALLALCALLAACGAAWASPPMVFRHLTADDGLSQNTVMSVLQDSRGFIWIATEGGLDRYDGYSVRRYGRSRGDPNGLSGSYIWAVREDAHGDLWLAVWGGGVARFDPRSERFTTWRHDPRDPASLSSDSVRQLMIDRRGRVWIATTGGGLNVLDPASNRITRFAHDEARADSLSSDVVTSLAEDRDGRIWVGTDAGLDAWLPDGNVFEHFRHDARDPRSIASDRISSLYVDRAGTVWVGTFDGGLNAWDSRTRAFRRYDAELAEGRAHGNPEIRATLEDSAGRLWVGTAHGLHLLDRETGAFTLYAHDAANPSSLRDSYVMSLYEDRSGLLWVGTRGGGVGLWNPRSWLFGHERPAWLAGSYAIAFADDVNGRFWVGMQGAGLVRFDPASGEAKTVDAVYGRQGLLPDARVMALLRDRGGGLWIGTMTGGLLRIARDGRVSRFRGPKAGESAQRSLGADGVMALYEAVDGRIWVGTFGGGIAIVDPLTEQVQRVPFDPRSDGALSSPRATAIAQGIDGVVWVGTEGGGLNALRPDGTVIAAWREDAVRTEGLSAASVYAVHVDRDGQVWIGTDGGGLERVLGSALTPASVRFEQISVANGLSSDTIYGIRSDASGALWLSGNKGLMRYEPRTRALRLYHRDDGLQGEDFNFGAHFRLRDGRLVFGGPDGFNVFDPAALVDSRAVEPIVALTGIAIAGRPAVVDAPYPLVQSLTLGDRDDVVAFEFAALDFAAPGKNLYSYRLRGFDENWSQPGTARRATYTNLDPGSYVFEVRAASSDGAWSSTARTLALTVRPAPWRSPLAYFAYAVALALLVLAWHRRQRNHLRMAAEQSERLEREVAARTAELTERNAELARVTRAKSDFLARMSHEIRTPMNGIIGMGELLARTPLDPHQSRLAGTIRSSSQALLRILNDILDLAKVEAGRLDLESAPFQLAPLLSETADLFAAQADEKGVELVIAPAPDLAQPVLGDATRLRQVLANLVGNAVKFTSRGEVVLRVDVTSRTESEVALAISVRDTGPGMSAEVVARVFEPFVQADESTTRRFGGTGLGLTICRELVELMRGTIDVTSEPDIGSEFTVRLSLPLAPVLEPACAAGPRRHAVIATRRTSLADALQRQCALLGIASEPAPAEGGTAVLRDRLVTGSLLLIDADTCRSEALALRDARLDPAFAARCVYLGTPRTLAALELLTHAPQAIAIEKPARSCALRDALFVERRVTGTRTAAESVAPEVPVAGLHGHVLVVDDNAVNAAVVTGLLAELGCTYVSVDGGRAAVARARGERFDAILMDMHMPDIDGHAAAGLIRRAEDGTRRTPIIAFTADSGMQHRDACLAAGMDGFLSKPATLQQLRAALAEWLSPVASGGADGGAGGARVEDAAGDALAHIAALERGGRRGLLNRIADLFIAGNAQQVEAISTAVAGGDLATVRRECHSLKSAAAHVGAADLARLASELERAALADDLSRVRFVAGGLRGAAAEAVARLRAEVARRSA